MGKKKPKTKGIEKWVVKRETEYNGWGVWLGGFRHCWDENKHVAQMECERLNKLDGYA